MDTVSKKKVLIVEDDEVIRLLLEKLLRKNGFDVVSASNGQEGIDFLRKGSDLPHLVLLDMMMPVKDGFYFLREQEANAEFASIPVIVMTAADKLNRPEAPQIHTAAKGIIRKPFDIGDLIKMIKKFC